MAKKPDPKWRQLFADFVDKLRIVSREETSKLGEGGTKVELWGSQRMILDQITAAMDKSIRKFDVLKSRQLGSTTIFVIIAIFWHAVHQNMKGAMVFDQEKTRDDFREVIRNIINSIPKAYFGSAFGIKKNGDNKYFMAFTNGSQINFLVAGTSGSKVSWGESSGYSFVLLTEVANYGSADGLSNFEEAMSETNPDRLYIFESTGKGRNHWHARWLEGRADPYTTCCIFVGWWSKELNSIPRTDPRYAMFGLAGPSPNEKEKMDLVASRYNHKITQEQLAWIRWRGSKISQAESSLLQNQPWIEEDCFQVSGRSYFQTRLIGHDLDRLGAMPYRGYRFWMGRDFWSVTLEQITGEQRRKEIELRIWHEPHPEGRYVIGVDPAGGSDDKNDRHIVSVWRCYADRFVQVAEYADNRSETRQVAWVLAYLAGIYRNCQINLELSGGYGKAVMVELEHLRDLLRADMNREKRSSSGQDWQDFLSNARYYIYKKPDSPMSAGYVLNWITTNDNKRQILNEFRDAHINGQLVIASRGLLEEMIDVVQDGAEIGAPGHQKDDRVIAACLACHLWVQDERPGMLMRGETFAAVDAAEKGEVGKGHMVNRIVAEHFRIVQEHADDPDDLTEEQSWMQERGLV